MPEAIRAKDTDPNAAVKAAKKAERKAGRAHTKRTFDQLNSSQRDDLLKQCALKLGLIKLDP